MPSPPDPLPHRALSPLPDPAAQEAANRALTHAHIQFRRGLLAEAAQAVQEILAARPADAEALELRGDIRLAQQDTPGALEAYREALQSQPGRPSAETKMARLTLRQAEQHRLQTLGVAYAASDTGLVRSGADSPNKRSRTLLILSAAICPGLGQILSGQTVKGGILAGIFLLGLVLLALLSHSFLHNGQAGAATAGPACWLVTGVIIADWLYAVIDSALAAGRTSAEADPEKEGWQV